MLGLVLEQLVVGVGWRGVEDKAVKTKVGSKELYCSCSEQRLCHKCCQTALLLWQHRLDNPFGKILVGPNTLSSVIQ